MCIHRFELTTDLRHGEPDCKATKARLGIDKENHQLDGTQGSRNRMRIQYRKVERQRYLMLGHHDCCRVCCCSIAVQVQNETNETLVEEAFRVADKFRLTREKGIRATCAKVKVRICSFPNTFILSLSNLISILFFYNPFYSILFYSILLRSFSILLHYIPFFPVLFYSIQCCYIPFFSVLVYSILLHYSFLLGSIPSYFILFCLFVFFLPFNLSLE